TDNGASWYPANQGLPEETDPVSVSPDLSTADIYMIANNGSVYRTLDVSNSWQLVVNSNSLRGDLTFHGPSNSVFVSGYDSSEPGYGSSYHTRKGTWQIQLSNSADPDLALEETIEVTNELSPYEPSNLTLG